MANSNAILPSSGSPISMYDLINAATVGKGTYSATDTEANSNSNFPNHAIPVSLGGSDNFLNVFYSDTGYNTYGGSQVPMRLGNFYDHRFCAFPKNDGANRRLLISSGLSGTYSSGYHGGMTGHYGISAFGGVSYRGSTQTGTVSEANFFTKDYLTSSSHRPGFRGAYWVLNNGSNEKWRLNLAPYGLRIGNKEDRDGNALCNTFKHVRLSVNDQWMNGLSHSAYNNSYTYVGPNETLGSDANNIFFQTSSASTYNNQYEYVFEWSLTSSSTYPYTHLYWLHFYRQSFYLYLEN